jgi:hypothetical protein
MIENYIEYNSKKYEIKELTISMWSNIMKYKNILDDIDMYVKMISEMTGLSSEEIRNSNATSIVNTGQLLYKFLNKESKEIHYNINFEGIDYTLVDFNNISFGQFVDIDTFISKDESYRISNLNELAAYLYTEKGKNYGDKNFKKNIEIFKELPLKYVEGAVFFLSTLERELQNLSQIYSKNKLMWQMIRLKVASLNFGDTIYGLVNSQKTKFGKLILLLLSPLWLVLITFLTLWIYAQNKIKQLKNK